MSAISLFAVLAVVTDTLCPQVMAPVEAADVHVRCRVPWRLEWRDAASGEARCLAIDVSHDNIYGDKASVEYVAGTDSVLARWNIDAKDASGPVSLRIAKDLYGTHLYAVNGEERAKLAEEFCVSDDFVSLMKNRWLPRLQKQVHEVIREDRDGKLKSSNTDIRFLRPYMMNW